MISDFHHVFFLLLLDNRQWCKIFYPFTPIGKTFEGYLSLTYQSYRHRYGQDPRRKSFGLQRMECYTLHPQQRSRCPQPLSTYRLCRSKAKQESEKDKKTFTNREADSRYNDCICLAR